VGRSKARRQRDRELKTAARVIVAKALAVKEKENGWTSSSSGTGVTGRIVTRDVGSD